MLADEKNWAVDIRCQPIAHPKHTDARIRRQRHRNRCGTCLVRPPRPPHVADTNGLSEDIGQQLAVWLPLTVRQ